MSNWIKEENPWYSPGAVFARFSAKQVDFVLDNATMMREGKYPPECRTTGYEEGNGWNTTTLAPFIVPCEVVGELSARVMMCGSDAFYMEYIYGLNGVEEPHDLTKFCHERHLDIEMVKRRIRSIKEYCEGSMRKTESYQDFRAADRKNRGYSSGR